MALVYTEEDFLTALANSVGPIWWTFNGPKTSGYNHFMAMREAAINRWLRNLPEDEDSAVLRQAYRDLEARGFFNFSERIDDE